MEILKRLLILLAFIALPSAAAQLPYTVIAYHDVRDDVAENYDPDQYALSTANLIDQFNWLRDHDFNPVSIDQILAARRGEQQLPSQAVLLTFDDGLASVYSRVFPLLKLFDYPAVVSVVTSWIETDGVIDYAGQVRGRDGFLSSAQLREMHESGLVEIASHTHDLHKGIRGNPQGSLQPAAVTRQFDGSEYESESAFRRRIDADLAVSVNRIAEITGERPRVIVWPYGAFNQLTEEIANDQGMSVSLTLTPDSAVSDGQIRLGRYLLSANPGLYDFSAQLTAAAMPPVIRVAQIDLDYIYDADSAQQDRNLDTMLDRIKSLKISHVFLQAFVDDDADGGADEVYFPNRHLPMRDNLFDFVAWQLKTRAEVSVFAWLPMLSFSGDAFDEDWRVLENRDGEIRPDPASEPRLSPFSAAALERIAEVYEDLAVHSHVDGIFFHDDGRLSDLEDYSDAGREKFRAEFSQEMSPALLTEDAQLRRNWANLKAQTIIEVGAELAARARRFNPSLKTARNIFSSALLDDAGVEYLAQDYDAYLQVYDFVVLMAMPALEGAASPENFYRDLVTEVARRETGLDRTVFELQTFDWVSAKPVASDDLRTTMRWLQSLGVRNLGYYPDDFIGGKPDFDQLRQGISLADDFSGAGQ